VRLQDRRPDPHSLRPGGDGAQRDERLESRRIDQAVVDPDGLERGLVGQLGQLEQLREAALRLEGEEPVVERKREVEQEPDSSSLDSQWPWRLRSSSLL
jgi:hypothetical protein